MHLIAPPSAQQAIALAPDPAIINNKTRQYNFLPKRSSKVGIESAGRQHAY
jgi:hypothetical protein